MLNIGVLVKTPVDEKDVGFLIPEMQITNTPLINILLSIKSSNNLQCNTLQFNIQFSSNLFSSNLKINLKIIIMQTTMSITTSIKRITFLITFQIKNFTNNNNNNSSKRHNNKQNKQKFSTLLYKQPIKWKKQFVFPQTKLYRN